MVATSATPTSTTNRGSAKPWLDRPGRIERRSEIDLRLRNETLGIVSIPTASAIAVVASLSIEAAHDIAPGPGDMRIPARRSSESRLPSSPGPPWQQFKTIGDVEWSTSQASWFGESTGNREIERSEALPVQPGKVLGLSISGYAFKSRLLGPVDEVRIRAGVAQNTRCLQAGQNADVVLWRRPSEYNCDLQLRGHAGNPQNDPCALVTHSVVGARAARPRPERPGERSEQERVSNVFRTEELFNLHRLIAS